MNRRAKGVTAEREVARVWEAAGLEVRNLEQSGDHLVIVPERERFEARQGLSRRSPTRRIQRGFRARDPWLPLVDIPGAVIHSEVKRQERLKLPEWLRQAADEAPAGAIPVVSFRQNGGQWYACLPLADLAELVAR